MTDETRNVRATCHSCGETGDFKIVFSAAGIPINSCILLDRLADAQAYPTGDMSLALCPACGVACNLDFDQSLVQYDASYEESQIHSPTFAKYARRMIADWFERFNLADAHVVEIGCGQGEFLSLFLEHDIRAATGIDPACRAQSSDRLTLINEKFSPELDVADADFIFCRHTLEHLFYTGELLEQIKALTGPGSAVPVCFEVPDFKRIIAENAFWDVYYEHCSYFTSETLAGLFCKHGFDVSNVRFEYGDQYLVIETRPALNSDSGLPVKSTVSNLLNEAQAFSQSTLRARAKWNKQLDAWSTDDKKIALWGSGSKAVGFLTALTGRDNIDCVVDINPDKQGFYMPGCTQKIVGPADLTSIRPDVIIIMNPIYISEISADLGKLGLQPELVAIDAVHAAGEVAHV